MSVSRCVTAVLSFFLAGMWFGAPAGAVVDGRLAPNADRRFDAVALLFTATPWTVCGGWVSGTCTLIRPDTVLIARHSLGISTLDPLPSLQTHPLRVRFRRTIAGYSEDQAVVNGVTCHGAYQEFDVVELTDAPNRSCDQVLGRLSRVPIGIQPIGIELANPPIHPTNIILAGWGFGGECLGAGDPWALRVARGVMPENGSGNDYLSFSWCVVGTVAPCLQCPTTGGPWVAANLHDSGAPILIEVPSTDPRDPMPELRIVGTVSSTATARRPSAWNNSGGAPSLAQATPLAHLRRGDFDGDGRTTSQDIMSFLSAFFSGGLDADADISGTLTMNDLFVFLHSWFEG